MKKLKNIEIKPVIFLIFISVIFIIGLTIAYMSTRSTFENKFKSSAYNIELREEFNNDWGKKKVSIINNDSTPVVLRINYNEIWSEKNNPDINNTCRVVNYNTDSNKYTLSNIINGEDVVTKNWTSTWKSFIKANDGWYYYTKVINSNDNIQILYSIALRKDLISSSNCYENYKNYEYELSFNYEVIQADINAIKDIWEYDVSINEGNISWPF